VTPIRFEDSPDTAVLAADIAAWVPELLDAGVHADAIRDLVEAAIRDWVA
jgi:hypothetical protein